MPIGLCLCTSFLSPSLSTSFDDFQAESLTGIENAVQAGQELLKRGVRTKWVIVKVGPKGSILITKSSISCAPAFKV